MALISTTVDPFEIQLLSKLFEFEGGRVCVCAFVCTRAETVNRKLIVNTFKSFSGGKNAKYSQFPASQNVRICCFSLFSIVVN